MARIPEKPLVRLSNTRLSNDDSDDNVDDDDTSSHLSGLGSDGDDLSDSEGEQTMHNKHHQQHETEDRRHVQAAQKMLDEMKRSKQSGASNIRPEDANDVVYKALMDHKKAEMQRMTTLASDTRTITEAMLRKQVVLFNSMF